MLRIESVVYKYLMSHNNSSARSAAFEKARSMKHGTSVSMWMCGVGSMALALACRRWLASG